MIDFHTHPVMIKELHDADPAFGRAVNEVFGFYFPPQSLTTFLLEMDAAGVDQAVLLPLDCTTAHHCTIASNETISKLAERNDRLIGFASVDPSWPDAPRRLEQAVRELGLRGLKLDPALQRFHLNDAEKAYPLYQVCSELKIPLLVHCGLSWAPLGQAKFSHPLDLEEVAQRFPDLDIVIAHFGWPWFQEAVMLALKFPRLYLDTSIIYSGTPRDALDQVFNRAIGASVLERSLYRQVLFATNYPRTDMRRCVRGIQQIGLSHNLLDHLFAKNARRILGLAAEDQ